MKKHSQRVLLAVVALGVLSCAASRQVEAQTTAKANGVTGVAGITGGRLYISPDGNEARLVADKNEPAHISYPPQLDVQAQVIKITGDLRHPTKLEATDKISLKLSIMPRDQSNGAGPTNIDVQCDKATVTRADSRLVLSGHVNGWYQVGDGGKTNLRGETVTVTFNQGNLLANVAGGSEGVRVELPPNFGAATATPVAATNAFALGATIITARDAVFDESKRTARFIGNARAVSNSGTDKFDISAPEFIIRLNANRTPEAVETQGRTHLTIDTPPKPAPANAVAVVDTSANKSKGETAAMPRPRYIDANADAITLTISTRTLIINGNLKGYYLVDAPGPDAIHYEFSGKRGEIRFPLTELGAGDTNTLPIIDFSGEPFTIKLPVSDTGFWDNP